MNTASKISHWASCRRPAFQRQWVHGPRRLPRARHRHQGGGREAQTQASKAPLDGDPHARPVHNPMIVTPFESLTFAQRAGCMPQIAPAPICVPE